MSAPPIVDPPAPYVGPIPQGLHPGKMVRIQGVALPDGDRFVVNLATGPNEYQDDIGLHLSVRLNQGYIARNSYINGEWLDEQGDGVLPIAPGQRFEILLLCDINDYKVAINGQHFCEFPYRTPYRRITHLHVNGDLKITLISWEGSAPPQMGDMSTTPRPPFEAPPPRPPFDAPPPQYSSLGYGPAAAPGYGPPPSAGYGAPPATTAVHFLEIVRPRKKCAGISACALFGIIFAIIIIIMTANRFRRHYYHHPVNHVVQVDHVYHNEPPPYYNT